MDTTIHTPDGGSACAQARLSSGHADRLLGRLMRPAPGDTPQFEGVAELRPQYQFAKVDADSEPAIAGRYAVRSIPTVIVLRDGEPVASQAGVIGAEQLVEALNRIAAGLPTGAATDRKAA